MAINKITQNGFEWLTGVYFQQPTNQPVFLGVSGLCETIPFAIGGTFYIGFDNRIQPAVVRIFYDPPPRIQENIHTIGLIQFGEYRFQGEPLPPERYSPEIDYKNSYRKQTIFATEHFWLDIMDAQNAHGLLRPGGQPLPPFFAYNGMLHNRSLQAADFYTYGRPNGSLLKLNQQFQANDSLAATLKAPVGLDLDVLDQSAITKVIDRYLNNETPIFDEQFAPGNLDTIQYVLSLLNRKKGELEPDMSDATPLIDEGDIRWVKAVGPFLLIQFDDPEDIGGLICVFVKPSDGKITAYSFDTYTFERLVIEANITMFEKHKLYQKEKKTFSNLYGLQPPPPRGRKSLESSPFLGFEGQQVVVSFMYRTLCYAYSAEKFEMLGGVQWEVGRKFDFADSQWGMLEFARPKGIWFVPSESPYNLSDFRELLQAPTPPTINPPTTPAIWFATSPIIADGRQTGFGPRAIKWIGT